MYEAGEESDDAVGGSGRDAAAGPCRQRLWGDIAEGLELPVQLIYLTTLLGFLFVGAYVVVQQVLSKRGMDEMAKDIGERSRNQEATPV